MFEKFFGEIIREEEQKRASELGLSLQAYRDMVKETELKRKEEEERYYASDEYKKKLEQQKQAEELKKHEILINMFQQPVDEIIKVNKTNLRKIIRWTASRFNERRKEDVVEMVMDNIINGVNGFTEYSCGAYSNNTKSRKNKNYGFTQHLAILDGQIRWLDGYNSDNQKVYELVFNKVMVEPGKNKVTKGQEIIVSLIGNWHGKAETNLKKFIVIKANNTSFYAIPIGTQNKPMRFSQADLTCRDSLGSRYQAYLDEAEYWTEVNNNDEEIKLKEELIEAINEMSLMELKAIRKKVMK